jgi:hypothetical protein
MGKRLFKTEPLQIDEEPQPGQEQNFLEQLFTFFKKLWAPQTTTAEQLGWAYTYGEGGTLLAEVGMGGANSTGRAPAFFDKAVFVVDRATLIRCQELACLADIDRLTRNGKKKIAGGDGCDCKK